MCDVLCYCVSTLETKSCVRRGLRQGLDARVLERGADVEREGDDAVDTEKLQY